MGGINTWYHVCMDASRASVMGKARWSQQNNALACHSHVAGLHIFIKTLNLSMCLPMISSSTGEAFHGDDWQA
jgi:hypothetical protein